MQSRVLAILVAVVLALVATAALVVYVNGADRRAISDQEPVKVWVAIKPIPAGTSGLNASNTGLIEQVEMPKKNAVKGGVVSLTQIQNKFAAVDIVEDEQLLLSRWVGSDEVAGRRLLPIPEKHQALSIGVELTRQVAGFVTPGDPVSMVVTLARKNGAGKDVDTSQFLLQNVQVLAVGTTALSTASCTGRRRPGQPGQGEPDLDRRHPGHPRTGRRAGGVRGRVRLDLPDPDAAERRSRRTGGPVDAGNVIPPGQQ